MSQSLSVREADSEFSSQYGPPPKQRTRKAGPPPAKHKPLSIEETKRENRFVSEFDREFKKRTPK